MTSFSKFLQLLPEDNNLRGREFERVAKWFIENDPTLRHEYERIWQWAEWPGAWAADAGIDLVAERKDGCYVAIQVKCYRSDRLVTKRDMNTFLSESSRPIFAERLLIATCDGLGRTAARTVEGQDKPVRTLFYDYLDRSPVVWPADLRALRPSRPKPKRPRPHQRRAVNDVVNGFETAERGQLIMACGTGKTLTCLWIAERVEASRTLVLVPSLSLLSQTVTEWTSNDARGFEFIAVCSDESVVDVDAPVAHTWDLPFTGVTSDPSEIAAFLRRRGPRVVFGTYQSSPRIAEAQALSRVPRFDLAIADEAHRCAGRPDAAFATILDAGSIRARHRLFTTATPRIATGRLKREADDLGLEVTSMDDVTKFGGVLHRLSFADAIQEDLLSDYRVAIVVVDNETVHDYVERGVFVELGDGIVRDARTLAAQIGLLKAMQKYGLRRVLSFHSRVNLAARFAASLRDLVRDVPSRERLTGYFWSEHVSGEMPSGQRDRLLRRLRSVGPRERAVLANARCLTEGVDVPALDGVAFIDPRRSQVDVVQAVGRAIRKAEDKNEGTIVLPIFVAHTDADPEGVLDRSVFEPVVEVLRALRDHDERLGDALDALRRELGEVGSVHRLPPPITLDAPTSVSIDFLHALQVQLIDLTTSSWDASFGRLRAYARDHGTVAHIAGDRYLIRWKSKQVRIGPDLSQERRELLESLAGWTWDSTRDEWDQTYGGVLTYVERNDSLPPIGFKDEDTLVWSDRTRSFNAADLGSWLRTQRRNKSRLSPEQIEALERLRGWSWKPHDESWDRNYRELAAFVARHGRIPSQKETDPQARRLGRWVARQRSARQTPKDKERRRRLEAIQGWSWNPRQDDWEAKFRQLEDYVRRFRRIPPVKERTELSQWVMLQRSYYRKHWLDDDKRERLSEVPGWFWEGVGGRMTNQ